MELVILIEVRLHMTPNLVLCVTAHCLLQFYREFSNLTRIGKAASLEFNTCTELCQDMLKP